MSFSRIAAVFLAMISFTLGVAPLQAAAPVTGTYVIVTTDDILSKSSQLKEAGGYVANMRRDGTTVIIATESTYGVAATADERARNIREWLKNNVKPGWHYVLLIGNPDPDNGDVPMKKYSDYGTDFYYAEMTGDWQAEPVVDHAELMVGRIPVYPTGNMTIASLDKILAKTSNYKYASDKEWRRYALLPVVPLFRSGDDYTFGETIANTILKPAGWQWRRLYEPYFGNGDGSLVFNFVPGIITMNPLPEEPYCNERTVLNNWNNNKPGLVVWHTHGDTNRAIEVASSYSDAEGGGSVRGLNDQYPAIVFAAACNNSKPQPYNIGAATLLYNAVAFVGGTKELSDANPLAKDFSQGIAAGGTVGDVITPMIPTPKSDKYALVLYGCPEISIDIPVYGLPAPQITSALPISDNRIDLSWSAVTNATKYVVERGDANATRVSGTFSEIARVDAPTVTYPDNSCGSATKYKYRVYALNNTTRSGYSAIDSSTTFQGGVSKILNPPGNVSATPGCYTADISWSGVNGASYNVKRSISSDGPFVTVGNTASVWYKDSNLINENTYYYVISSVNEFGQSVNSSSTQVVPQKEVPKAAPEFADPAVRNVKVNSFEYWWLNPNSDNTMWYEIEYYYYQNVAGSLYKITPPPLKYPRTHTMNVFEHFGNNQTVYYRIRGWNEYGESPWTSEGSGTTLPGRAINVPMNFRGASQSSSTYLLQWDRDPSNPPITRYEIYTKGSSASQEESFVRCWDKGDMIQAVISTSLVNTTDTFSIRAVYIDPTTKEISYSPFSSKLVLAIDRCLNQAGGGGGMQGAAFGLTPSGAAGSEYCKATDGDINTFYDYSQGDGAYTGLDLGLSPKVIEKIRFYPRAGWTTRMIGGKFQGSNISNSSGFVDLYTIPATPEERWNEVTIPNTTVYRWVRYLAPDNAYGNIAEMEFYGSHYIIIASAGPGQQGTISPNGKVTVTEGANQKFTITPNPGYRVSSVIVDDEDQGPILSYTFPNITGNHTISAWMSIFELLITASAGPNGSISPWGSVKVLGNTNQTFTFTPNTGYQIDAVTINGINHGAIPSYTFTNVTADSTISVTFKPSCLGVQGGGNGLKGTTFGLNPPWAAGSEYCKATDGDINTFYDYSQANGGYTGLDFGSAKVVTKIRYYPRNNSVKRTVGGKFQGSNASNSDGYVDLYTITATQANAWNEVIISNSTGYRYVRYLSPDGGFCNMAEMEFYEAGLFPNPTKWYKIAPKANPSLCLDVTGGVYDRNTAIELWTKTNINQEFKFQNVNDGFFTITCRKNTGFSIDMGGTFAPRQTLKLWNTEANNQNQKFKVIPVGNGYYRLESSNPGFSIDNTGSVSTTVKPWLDVSDNYNDNQKWLITEVQ